MSSKKKIILMYGGRSGEHEISLRSASSVLSALNKDLYDISCVSGDKKGNWFLHDARALAQHDPLKPLPAKPDYAKEIFLSTEHFKDAYAVLPIMHGPLFEDGSLQGFLNLCNVAYVGSNHLGSAMAMDKEITKLIVKSNGIEVAPFQILRKSMSTAKQQEIQATAIEHLGFPLFVKPACLGSSVGIHRVTSKAELTSAVHDALLYDNKIIIEQGMNGREIEVAVLKQGNEISVSCAGEICMPTKEEFYSYDAKYHENSNAKLVAPAVLSNAQLTLIQEAAKKIFVALECDGLARIDFFYDEDCQKLILNEVNTLPGFTSISMYPKLWQLSGIEYGLLLDKLIEQANWQYQQAAQLLRNYQ